MIKVTFTSHKEPIDPTSAPLFVLFQDRHYSLYMKVDHEKWVGFCDGFVTVYNHEISFSLFPAAPDAQVLIKNQS